MPRPPHSPDPPDPADDPPLDVAFDELVDVVATDRDWAGVQALRLVAHRAELRRCRPTGAELAEAVLRDVTFVECRVDRRASATPSSSESSSLTAGWTSAT